MTADLSPTVQSLHFLHLNFSDYSNGVYNGKTEDLIDCSVTYPEQIEIVKAQHPSLRELRLMGIDCGV